MKHAILLFAAAMQIQAADVSTVINQFYVDLHAEQIRGTLAPNACEQLLTPSFASAVKIARQNIEIWCKSDVQEPAGVAIKLPFTEGSIYTAWYDCATFERVKDIREFGDRALVTVCLQCKEGEKIYRWEDYVVLHKISDDWKIDDVLSNVGENGVVSIRSNFDIPLPPTKAEQGGAPNR